MGLPEVNRVPRLILSGQPLSVDSGTEKQPVCGRLIKQIMGLARIGARKFKRAEPTGESGRAAPGCGFAARDRARRLKARGAGR